MKILVVGSGAREHALCWSFKQSPLCDTLICAPGNPGIAKLAELAPVKATDLDGLINLAHARAIDFVMIGPEQPLALGLADRLAAEGILCFGPTQAAAQLESSKGFMKDLCREAGIPTAAYARFTDADAAKAYVRSQGAPIVVKADGLAAGKGVTVARTVDEALAAIDAAMLDKSFGASGEELVIEECMEGEEASFFALSDGNRALFFTTAQDHKAVFDGDKGPNTGGMGAYSPAPVITDALRERVMREIIDPTVAAMKAKGCPFTGVLYAGLMLTKDGPKLIEYNARFGDPETQVMLPRLASDLLAALIATAKGQLDQVTLVWKDEAALCVVMAAEGYPGTPRQGTLIRDTDKAEALPSTMVFHAGTALNAQGDLVAAGGRVLGVTATAPTIKEAQRRAYQAIALIHWPEGFNRTDIGWRAAGVTPGSSV